MNTTTARSRRCGWHWFLDSSSTAGTDRWTAWLAYEQRWQIWLVRYFVVAPAILLCLALSYTRNYSEVPRAVSHGDVHDRDAWRHPG